MRKQWPTRPYPVQMHVLTFLCRWRVESNTNPHLPANAVKVNYQKPGFLSKFAESHLVMFNINNGLTSSHPYDSRPGSWPLLYRGISFWSSKDKRRPASVYLIGNPVVWFSAVLGLLAYTCYNIVVALLMKRKIILSEDGIIGVCLTP